MELLNRVLPNAKDRELLVRPFDNRWEALLTFYASNVASEVLFRGVGRSPTEAIERAEEDRDHIDRS
jgi:hypothetical protein